MKKLHLIAVLLAALGTLNCTRNPSSVTRLPVEKTRLMATAVDSVITPLDTNCHLDGPVVGEAKDWEGEVRFTGTTNLYCIVYGVPNTTDTQWFGYVCNMPNEFKRGSLKVQFSGTYYQAYKYFKHPGIDGRPQLYLKLKNIRLL